MMLRGHGMETACHGEMLTTWKSLVTEFNCGPYQHRMHTQISREQKNKWTHWDLNPRPSACEADVIPLHHVPRAKNPYQH